MKLAQLFSLYNRIRRERRTMCKTEAKRPRQHASAFVLESLENRVLLSATPVDVPTTEPVVTAAVVTTDKADYAPGETALINTSNTNADGLKFGDGELVQFQVTRTDGIQDSPMGNVPWYVTDGVGGFKAYEEFDANGQVADWISPDNDLTVNGSISTNWFVEDQYLGASLLLTATGQASGAVATTEFTDALGITSVSPNFGTTLGGTVVTITGSGYTNGQDPFTVSFDGGTTFVSGTRIDNTHLTATTPAHLAGTFNVVVRDKGAISGQATLANGFTYVNAITTTTVSSSSLANTSTYGDSVTFTATVNAASGSAAPTGSVEFFDGASLLGTASAADSTGTGTSTWSITTSGLNAGAHSSSIHAVYTATGGFTGSTSTNITQTVNAKAISYTIGNDSHHYGSTANLAADLPATFLTGVNGQTLGIAYSSTGNTTTANVGTYAITGVVADGTGLASNYTVTLTNGALTVNKASSTTTNNGVPSSAVYTGSAQGISGTTVTGAGGLATVATSTVYYDTLGTVATGDDVLLGGAPTNAGSYRVVSTYVGDLNHTGSSDTDYFSIGKATLTGLATTQSALNIAKQGVLVFSLNSVTGMVNGDTLVSLLSSMSFTLKIGVNTYAFAPSVAIDTHGDGDASNDTVVVTYSLKNGGDAGQLAADLQALNCSDGIASTSASNAQVDAIWVNMSTANYTFRDDALTKLFYS